MIAEGRKCVVELSEGILTLRSQGTFLQRRPEQVIAVRQIRAVHFKPAGLRAGVIYFDNGSMPSLSTPAYQAADRRNGCQFFEAAEADFIAIKREVERLISDRD